MLRDLRHGLVDPDLVRRRGGDGPSSHEALGVRDKGGVEDGGTALESLRGEAVVHVVRSAEAERAVVVVVVVLVEERAGGRAGGRHTAELLGAALSSPG